jgi:hypothetical protein
MLEAKTEEQRETIFGILGKDNQTTYYSFEDGDVENIMIDGNISFDAMAKIADYLRWQNNKQQTDMEKLKQVDDGYEFNKEGYGWTERVITDESVLAVLEMRYNIQIALAIEYKEGNQTKSIRIVTKDRKHYKLYL